MIRPGETGEVDAGRSASSRRPVPFPDELVTASGEPSLDEFVHEASLNVMDPERDAGRLIEGEGETGHVQGG